MSSITVSPKVYELLAERAQQSNQTPDALAERLLLRSLTLEMQQWRQSFDALVERIQTRSAHFASDEIEADITVAAEEAKESRRGRRSGR